jgi:hypothetical protein
MLKYVPILRGKVGEFAALQNLDGNVLYEICPFIQFLPDTNKDRVGDYLTNVISKLTNAWNFDGNLMYLDVSYLDNIKFISGLANSLKGNEINIIPVIHPNSMPEYIKMIKKGFLDNGICIRIKRAYASPDKLIETIQNSMMTLDITESEIDILIDLQYVDNEDDLPIYQNTFLRLYDSIKNPRRLRRIIIGSGSFPTDVADFPVNRISQIPRIEWSLWNRIKHDLEDFPVIYADYGNIHPIYNPLIQTFEGSCSIKYTSDSVFYIFRGIKASGHIDGGGQYHQKSSELISSPIYDGIDFSWGDENIYKCANHEISSGNAGTWVKYTLNHHFMKILDLFA